MELIRDLVLFIFAGIWFWAMPFYGDVILNPVKSSEFVELVKASPIVVFFALIPIALVLVPLIFLHKIDNWIEQKEINRHNELLDALKSNPLNESVRELINEIRQERNERRNTNG